MRLCLCAQRPGRVHHLPCFRLRFASRQRTTLQPRATSWNICRRRRTSPFNLSSSPMPISLPAFFVVTHPVTGAAPGHLALCPGDVVYAVRHASSDAFLIGSLCRSQSTFASTSNEGMMPTSAIRPAADSDFASNSLMSGATRPPGAAGGGSGSGLAPVDGEEIAKAFLQSFAKDTKFSSKAAVLEVANNIAQKMGFLVALDSRSLVCSRAGQTREKKTNTQSAQDQGVKRRKPSNHSGILKCGCEFKITFGYVVPTFFVPGRKDRVRSDQFRTTDELKEVVIISVKPYHTNGCAPSHQQLVLHVCGAAAECGCSRAPWSHPIFLVSKFLKQEKCSRTPRRILKKNKSNQVTSN